MTGPDKMSLTAVYYQLRENYFTLSSIRE